jgi:hypothetical protein
MTVQDNKATVQAFYQTALNDRDADAALPYVGTSYRQHNPLVEEGYEGLRKYLDWNPRELPEIAERDPARLRRWPSARRRREATPSSTSSSWKTARSSSIGI